MTGVPTAHSSTSVSATNCVDQKVTAELPEAAKPGPRLPGMMYKMVLGSVDGCVDGALHRLNWPLLPNRRGILRVRADDVF